MKKFDLEAAKAGAPVVTRDGKKARIICFDKNGTYPIVALIVDGKQEEVVTYTLDGIISFLREDFYDLFMAPQKKEYWVNVYRFTDGSIDCGPTQSEATCQKESINNNYEVLATIKVYEEEV